MKSTSHSSEHKDSSPCRFPHFFRTRFVKDKHSDDLNDLSLDMLCTLEVIYAWQDVILEKMNSLEAEIFKDVMSDVNEIIDSAEQIISKQ